MKKQLLGNKLKNIFFYHKMPDIDFGQSDDISQVAGIGPVLLKKLNNGQYFKYKVTKISDIKPLDLPKLPLEAYYTIKYTKGRQFTRSEIAKIAKMVMKELNFVGEIVGSYRRQKTKLNDVDILTMNDVNVKESKNIKIIRTGINQHKLLVKIPNKDEFAPVDILQTTKERYPFALMHFTGSKEFNIHIRVHAKKRNCKLNQYGLYKNGQIVKGIKNEKDIFKYLNMPYLEPKNRTS